MCTPRILWVTGVVRYVLAVSTGKRTQQETITAFAVIPTVIIGTLNMRSVITLLCLFAVVIPLRADDEQMSALLVGTWSTSFDQRLYNNSTAKIQITASYGDNGQYEMDWIMAFSTGGGGRMHAEGNWEINNGILTTNLRSWAPQQMPMPQWDDGPGTEIQFSGPNIYHAHGVNWVRLR